MTTTPTASGVTRYVAVVCIGGAVMLGLVLTTGFDRAGTRPGETALFALLAFLAQLAPITMERGRSEKEVNVCGTFTFALLLSVGAAPAVLVAAASATAADLLHRKAPVRAAFNGLQTALSMGAAAMVLQLYDPDWMSRTFTETADVIPLFLAGGVMLVVNHLLVAGVVAISQGMPVTAQIRGDFGFQAATTGVMITMAPVLGAAAEQDLVLVPLLLVPLAAVYAAARGVSRKENTAFYDGLTGLPNRAWFQQWAIPGWAARTDGTLLPAARVAVMLIDLDRFKEVNDTLGHRVGDELLKLIGPRLEPSLGPDDKVARMGGDEFAVLLNDVGDEQEALRRAGLLLEGLEQPFELSGLSLAVEASMGIALGPDHGSDIDSLLQRADVAMYQAKEDRRGCELYSPERDPYSPEKLALLGELRAALETDQCVLHYQPKARLDNGEIVGVEVLSRWDHPDRGLLPPDLFVPLAERTGLSRTLTLYVLDGALRQCRRWHELGLEMKVAVNLSVRNLHDASFPEDVARLLVETGVEPYSLQLEITESTVMADPDRVMKVLLTLRAMGIELSLDDFGTGYSSLVYLKQLPLHELKIDKSFVTGMCRDESDAVIVRSTIDLARNLGLRVVAEGVEDLAVWDELKSLGCDVAQGYYLGRPVAADDLTRQLVKREAEAEAVKAMAKATGGVFPE